MQFPPDYGLCLSSGKKCQLYLALTSQVHRGVYEAAKLLYERYKPMVEEHLATSPFAKVAFIGHSLGGSLGSLLMLMFLHRGVVPISAISPTYTFGAPAIFCEASGPGGTCALNASSALKALPAGKQQSSTLARVVYPAVPKVNLTCTDTFCLHIFVYIS